MKTALFGHSDDVIRFETDGKRESINAYAKKYMLFADGTVLGGEYDDAGVWRFSLVRHGAATLLLVPFTGKALDDEYVADQCELLGDDVRLVWHGGSVPAVHPCLVLAARIIGALDERNCLRSGIDAYQVLVLVCQALTVYMAPNHAASKTTG